MKNAASKAMERDLNSGVVYKIIVEGYYDGEILIRKEPIYFYPGDTVTITSAGIEVSIEDKE